MSKSKWRETIGAGFGTGLRRGTSERKPVLNEMTGKEGGYHVEHWDDRQDAFVHPESIQMKLSIAPKEEA